MGRFTAVLFDLDGVITSTAVIHAGAWQRTFDEFLRAWSARTGQPFRPFDPGADYRRYVDGRMRHDGVRNFLGSRGLMLPEGTSASPPKEASVGGLANRKDALVQQAIDAGNVRVFPGAVALLRRVRQLGMKTAVVPSSHHCAAVLESVGLEHEFDVLARHVRQRLSRNMADSVRRARARPAGRHARSRSALGDTDRQAGPRQVAPPRLVHRAANRDRAGSSGRQSAGDRKRHMMRPAMNLQGEFCGIDIYLFDQLLRDRIRPGDRVFDAGCGAGRNLVYLLRAGFEVFGADADAHAVEQVRALAAELAPALPPGNFRAERLEALTFADAFATVVVSSAVLHFARSDAEFDAMLEGTWRTLAPGGLFFCRLASSIGLESQLAPARDGRRHRLPDGTERYLVDEAFLMDRTRRLRGALLDPLKTTVVQGQRSMTTWVVRKDGQ